MNVTACPSPDLLDAYVTGRLPLPDHEAIDGHLDACPACSGCVEARAALAGATWTHLRPPSTPVPDFDGPAFRDLVARAIDLAAPSPAGPKPGDVLGNYVLVEHLGAGGMGRVFKARHRKMGRLVALKVLAPDLLRSAAARARFQREVEALARLASPHVVAAFDAGEADGHDFLVMEYAEGTDLADLVKAEGPLPVDRALRCVLQAARGLEHAHAAGVVHRDVKPANLLLGPGDVVKVLDLGLARVRQGDDTTDGNLTGSAVVMGTAAYVAPEQALDTHRADGRADVYSLGCCLYYLLTGRPPFEGRTTMEVLLAHRELPFPSVRAVRPDCPPVVDALLRRFAAKRPDDRPATMTAAARELERTLETLGTRPRPGTRWWRPTAAGVVAALAVAFALAALALTMYSPPGTGQSGGTFPDEGSARAVSPPTAPLAELNPIRPGPVEPPPRLPSLVETVLIPKGEFQMGSPDTDPDALPPEKPRHRVVITRPFHLGKTPVTQAQFEEVMGNNPSAFRDGGLFGNLLKGAKTGNHPVDSVGWLDALAFCNRLSKREDLPPYYKIDGTNVKLLGGRGYRLPTEAEWEYAARAGTDTRWSFGDKEDDLAEHAWYERNSGGVTHPVATRKPNPWGLYDTSGNVPQWCWDPYDPTAYRQAKASDPVATKGTTRVQRGGGWNDLAAQTRSASRQSLGEGYTILTHVGLRVARDVEP
jgi:formylglycine-generating enzyme required for sulfatase activity/tRNA A-37 threonylcarbamoyl transferase component Bud32